MLDEYDEPFAKSWQIKPSSNIAIMKEQARVSIDERGLTYAKDWIVEKLDKMASFLKKLKVTRVEQSGMIN